MVRRDYSCRELNRTAGCGPACPVVWEGGGCPSPYPDCTPGMGDNLGVKVSCGRCPDEPLAEGNCEGVNFRGEEAGEQNLDWMNKNCVERHRVLDKLAADSEVQKGSKQPAVNAARIRGK